MKNLVIIGAGDLGKEIVWLIEDINKRIPIYLILGFLDDDTAKAGTEFYGYKVLGGTEQLKELSGKTPLSAVIAIQDGTVRKKIVEEHPEFDDWETIIHPTAVIAGSSTIGKGSVIFPQVTVSVDSALGDFGLYYIHASICNDCVIGSYVSVMMDSTVGDHVTINELCCVEAGAQVKSHTELGERLTISRNNAIVGMGTRIKIVLIGAGGFGRETAVIIEDINRFHHPVYELLGFLDDGDQFHEGDRINGYPWLGTHEWAIDHKAGIEYVCTVADVHARAAIQSRLMEQGVVFRTIIGYGSYIAETAQVGSGCVFYTGVMISADVKIGDGVLVNTYSTIGHNVDIGDYTTISPDVGISGGCRIGRETTIGGHSYIIPGKKIGNGAVVGAGSIVVSNVKDDTRVFGNPAKRLDL
jgi:sugar O-acyltransferase (sialic acid O-acetyltransferase NeuD family)